MNKVIHGLILVFFAVACFFLWGLLTVTGKLELGIPMPAFSRLCLSLRPVVTLLPMVALAYCVWVWVRKSGTQPGRVGFFAATVVSLVLLLLPTLIATLLPLLDFAQRTARQ